jgi:HlyD family secretion protein
MKKLTYFAVATAALLASCSGKKDQADAYGTFEATEITVSSMATGKILVLNVEEGQLLDSSQQVGVIDTTDLYLKMRQAMDTRSATSSRKADLEAQIAVQEQNRENLMIDKKRIEKLLKDGAATQKQLDDVNAGLNLITRQIATIKTQFQGINDQISGIDQQISQAKEAIQNAYIINPVKGTVLTKYAEADEVATYGKPIYRLADLTEMTLRVYVTGAQLPSIKIGDKVKVLYDKDAKTNTATEGIVSWISQTAEFTPKTIQTKEERVNLVYAVKIRVRNDGSMKIGMPGEIELINQ